jgi:WD40 repeat protein
MTEAGNSPGFLIMQAARGMAPAIKGCALLLTPKREDPAPTEPGLPPPKALNYFGPRIVDQWATVLQFRPRAEWAQTLVRLASLPPADSRETAEAAVQRLAPDASPEDQHLAIEYLAVLPLAVRRSLVPEPGTSQLTLTPTITTPDNQSLMRLLPVDIPPFPLGSVVTGTPYRLEELLGMGGFGAVYKATNRFEQNQPPRAIKFCLEPSMVASLHRERAILDQLMAAGETAWSNRIVRLYGYALEVQPPFLVYEFVPGGDLTSYLMSTRQKTGKGFHPVLVLELIRQIAEGLAFAHRQGLVHRDLKPANILVSASTIKLTDFGIGGVVTNQFARGASISGTGRSQSQAAEQISLFRGSGTPLYMSSEQRRGDQPDPRHDLYSLGVVWYQLLVGDVTRELHPGWVDELTEEFRTPPGHISLIQRCVGYFKKRPVNADELLTLLPPPPSAAKPAKVPASAAREAEPAAEPSAMPQTTDGGTSRISGIPAPAPLPRSISTTSSRPLAAELEHLRTLLTDQIERDAYTDARSTVSAILRLDANDDIALAARAFLDNRGVAAPEKELFCLGEHQGWVRSVTFAPDPRRGLSAGDDAVLRLWDLENGRLMLRLEGHTGPVMSAVISIDGRRALSGGWDGTVRFWDIYTGQQLRCLQGSWKHVKSLVLAPDGFRAVFAANDPLVRVWDLNTGRELAQLAGHTGLVQSVAVTTDGRRALSGGEDGTLRLWDLESYHELSCWTGHTDAVTSVAIAPNGRWVLSGSSDMTLRLWDVETGRPLRRLTGHANWINAVAITRDGRRILSGSGGQSIEGRFSDGADTTLRLWDVVEGKELRCWKGHTASVTSVAVSSTGGLALSGGLDKTVRLWELAK